MKGEIVLLNVAGTATESPDILPRRCRREVNDDGKITSGEVYVSSSCIADVSVKTHRPQKTSASDTPEIVGCS
jgi:hypothetical protein